MPAPGNRDRKGADRCSKAAREVSGTTRYSSGNAPSSISASRTAKKSGAFIASTRSVTRPVNVLAVSIAPIHSKCSAHRSVRGWNSRTSSPLKSS